MKGQLQGEIRFNLILINLLRGAIIRNYRVSPENKRPYIYGTVINACLTEPSECISQSIHQSRLINKLCIKCINCENNLFIYELFAHYVASCHHVFLKAKYLKLFPMLKLLCISWLDWTWIPGEYMAFSFFSTSVMQEVLCPPYMIHHVQSG